MVHCEKCWNWFHWDCVGYKDSLRKDVLDYICKERQTVIGRARNCGNEAGTTAFESQTTTDKQFIHPIPSNTVNNESLHNNNIIHVKIVINRIGIMMYKYANNLLPPVINDMYTTNSDVHNYTTRQKHLLHVNKSNINIYSRSFANTSARIWNVMQSEIEVNVSISKFKMSSKMYLQEHTLHSKYSK